MTIEIRLSQYLSGDEAGLLKEKLEASNIPSIITCFGFLRFKYYSVYVNKNYKKEADPILVEFHKEVEQKRINDKHDLTIHCPICKTADIYRREKKSILDRIRFIGVSVWRCKVCENEWYT